MKILDLILDDGFIPGSTPGRIIGVRKMNKQTPDPSVLKYVLKVKKVSVVSCEAIEHALEFECEMDAWMSWIEEKRQEEVKKNV